MPPTPNILLKNVRHVLVRSIQTHNIFNPHQKKKIASFGTQSPNKLRPNRNIGRIMLLNMVT